MNNKPNPPPDSTCILSEEDVKNGRTEFAVSEDGKLLPCIRETIIKQAIELIPTESIAQFLTSPKVVAENELNNAPYVVDIAGEHLVAGTGDRALCTLDNPARKPVIYHLPGGKYLY